MRAIFFYVSGFYCFFLFGDTCGPSEYRSADGECCPMCNLGSVVYRDCSGDLSTTCKPCSPGTYMSEPNGLYQCFPCKHCAESQGLYILSKCTTIQDTICDVLDGYHCVRFSNSLCLYAEKHSVCRLGQETKTAGTKASDTECVDCAPGFYSPSGLNCTKWTDCAARNEIQKEDGSSVKDVTCEQKTRKRYGLLAFLSTLVIFAAVLVVLYLHLGSETLEVNKGDKRYRLPIEETSPEPTTSGQTPEENYEEPTDDT